MLRHPDGRLKGAAVAILSVSIVTMIGVGSAVALSGSEALQRQRAVEQTDEGLRSQSRADLAATRLAKIRSAGSRDLVIEVSLASGRSTRVGGVIVACISKKGIFQKAPCKKGEKKVSWNSTGPQGPPGANGAAGTPGANGIYYQISTLGAVSASTQTGTITIYCLAGGKAIAGGWSSDFISLLSGVSTTTVDRTGWQYNFFNDNSIFTASYYLETTCIK
jgi:hypothetical protein